MAQVPYIGLQTASPSSTMPEDYERQQATPADFGSQVGAAEEKVGGALGQASDVLAAHALKIQQTQNEVAARDINTGYVQQLSDRSAQFYSLQGKEAHDAYPQFQSDIMGLRQAAIDKASNPEMKELVAGQTTRYVDAMMISGSQHAAQQMRAGWASSADASAGTNINMAVASRTRPDMVNSAIDAAVEDVASKGKALSWSPEQIQLEQSKVRDQGYAKVVKALQVDDPMQAQAFLDANKGKLTGTAWEQLQGELKPLVNARTASTQIDNIVNGNQAATSRLITRAATDKGVDPRDALTFASIESGMGTVKDRAGSQYKGIFQLGDKEFTDNGGKSGTRGDISAEIQAGVTSMPKSFDIATQALGRPATGAEAYLVHQQGAAGGPALMKAPAGQTAVDALMTTSEWKNNPAGALAAIQGNLPTSLRGQASTMLASQFVDTWKQKYAQIQAGITVPDVNAPAGTQSTAADMLAQARQVTDAYGQFDPVHTDMVVRGVQARIQAQEFGDAQTERAAHRTLLDAAIGGDGTNKPIDVSQMLNTPELQDAWSRSPPETRASILQLLDHNARNVDPPMTQKAWDRYTELSGEASTDPASFVKENLANPDLYQLLPHHLLLGLANRKDAIDRKAAAEADSNASITHAQEVLRPDVLAAGIKTSPKPGSPDAVTFNQFTGKLSDAITQWRSNNNGKKPSDADIKAIGATLLQQVTIPHSGWIWDTKTHAFQVPEGTATEVVVPDTDRKQIIDAYSRKGVANPTSSQIQTAYLAGKKPRTSTATSPNLPAATAE